MKKFEQNRTKFKVQAPSTALDPSTLPVVSFGAEMVPAVESPSAPEQMSGAFATPAPTKSGDWQISPCGSKSRKKERKQMRNYKNKHEVSPVMKTAGEASKITNTIACVPESSALINIHSGLNTTETSMTHDEMIADLMATCTILPESTGFAYRWSNSPEGTESDLICESPLQQLQIKYAAWRMCTEASTAGDQNPDNPNGVSLSFGTLDASDRADDPAFKVIFELPRLRPLEDNLDEVLQLLGIPESPEIIDLPASYVFDIILEITNLDLRKTEMFSGFGHDDTLKHAQKFGLFSDLCSSIYEDFGHIAVPPLTLNEFANVLLALKNSGEEVGLAVLRNICGRDRGPYLP